MAAGSGDINKTGGAGGWPARRLLPWALPCVLIIVWQICAQRGWINPRILPSPINVFKAFWRLLTNGELLANLKVSCARAGTGFLIGGSLGLALGLSTATWRLLETVLDTTLQMIRTIPNLALLPLVIIWFGIGEKAKIFLIVCGVTFPIYLNTFHGIRSVDPNLITMARVYGLGRLRLWLDVILPGALPSILVGVRFSLGVMWMTLIVAETIAASSGLGYMATNAREMMQTDVIVLTILLYALLGKLADVVARALERRFLSWRAA
ncbi:MAG: ABC transporter permease subunit [Deltaproteobacteria bacterium]|jgi:sulfonate transport system permease protein|nr:ABC transporter permease subunit [Deltaproteobacteria bacterium]